jgi:hypothetical protein
MVNFSYENRDFFGGKSAKNATEFLTLLLTVILIIHVIDSRPGASGKVVAR